MSPIIEELFKKSPFDPLRHHMNAVMQCVALVPPLFEAVRDARHDEVRSLAKRVFKLEHDADVIKDEIRRTIPKRFFLPVYRGDLLGYLKLQDDMADSCEDVAALLTMKSLTLHPNLVEPTFEYIRKVLEVCQKTSDIANYLPKLVEGELSGPTAEHALKLIADVERKEWEADRLQHTLSQGLFALDNELMPTDLMLWFRIFGELGQLADFAEKTGDRLRRMLSG